MSNLGSFENEFFLKNFYDDLCYYNNAYAMRTLSTKIKRAAYTDEGIKELCSIMRFLISHTTSEFYETLVKYAEYKNIDINTTTPYNLYFKLIEDISVTCNKDGTNPRFSNFIERTSISCLIETIKSFIKRCNDNIEFIQFSYRIDGQTDERFSKMSLQKMLESLDPYGGFDLYDEKDLKALKDKDKIVVTTDKLSPEYGKMVCKRLRAMKADVLSATNKYLGPNSKFKEFKIMDIVI